MAQTQAPAYLYQDEGESIDYTPGSAVYGGDIVVVGTIPMLVLTDIAASAKGSVKATGVWKVPKKTGAVVIGDAIYWDADGDPVTGTAGTGAASTTGTDGYKIGDAVLASASGDDFVYVRANPAPMTLGRGGTEAANIKGIYYSGTIAVAVPSITDPDIAKVDVDVSAMTFAPAVGDAVIAIPLAALPTNARLQGAQVSATDTVQVTFGSEGGNVTGASKNFGFLFVDLT